MTTARIVLLVTSPRLPAGLLTAAAWDVVRSAPVLAGAESELTAVLRTVGAEVTVRAEGGATQALLDAVAAHGTAVWLAGPTGDEALARELGLRLAREPGLAELELMYGSWDPPGARLLDAVAVMDRLASPGGDPWKRSQTHRSLAGFLLEECYEAYDAISADDTDALREELGDVLLQVLLHARLAEELPDGRRWTVDDVAGGLVDKMVRRNPHVFSGEEAGSIEEIEANWERIKRAEKVRESVLDGIALSQPALALAAKVLDRAGRVGLAVPPPLAESQVDPEARLGAGLLATVAAARQAGLDPEAALRRATLAYAEAVRTAEQTP
ncbi:nucleoside triphosphate pyrophosphohydrolase [Micromonospora sp. PLK6-60]|uniref:nucleoside triphosphate pyrophosphohydrolase n=1 Tax=Micromonospora sp. PLK6-60 TaxID=2873383 RepID=UPI001CA70F25|nr:nucleoside triphosphate pyrophosphohydrolase [Micromonospora sp. PLK6-60]MBY8872096.1 nucleoside triphosphate pyrophosphohydrolase [Micromonospora sp. PLK6-60]